MNAATCVICNAPYEPWVVAQLCQACLTNLPSHEVAVQLRSLGFAVDAPHLLQPAKDLIESIKAAQVERDLRGSETPLGSITLSALVAADSVTTLSATPLGVVKPKSLHVVCGAQNFLIEDVWYGSARIDMHASAAFYSRTAAPLVVSDVVSSMRPLTMRVRNTQNTPAMFKAVWEVAPL